jgi:hypothetical protein
MYNSDVKMNLLMVERLKYVVQRQKTCRNDKSGERALGRVTFARSIFLPDVSPPSPNSSDFLLDVSRPHGKACGQAAFDHPMALSEVFRTEC